MYWMGSPARRRSTQVAERCSRRVPAEFRVRARSARPDLSPAHLLSAHGAAASRHRAARARDADPRPATFPPRREYANCRRIDSRMLHRQECSVSNRIAFQRDALSGHSAAQRHHIGRHEPAPAAAESRTASAARRLRRMRPARAAPRCSASAIASSASSPVMAAATSAELRPAAAIFRARSSADSSANTWMIMSARSAMISCCSSRPVMNRWLATPAANSAIFFTAANTAASRPAARQHRHRRRTKAAPSLRPSRA